MSLIILDVSKDDTIEPAAAKIKEDFGHLDVLVNNAGIVTPDPTTRESLRTAFDTNVFGAILLADAVGSLLKDSKSPKIINVSSVMGSIAMMMDPNEPYSSMIAKVHRTSCPGYVITDSGGDIESRKRGGYAESPETSAKVIMEIIESKRDSDVG